MDGVRDRLRATLAFSEAVRDARTKEKRQFPVTVHRILYYLLGAALLVSAPPIAGRYNLSGSPVIHLRGVLSSAASGYYNYLAGGAVYAAAARSTALPFRLSHRSEVTSLDVGGSAADVWERLLNDLTVEGTIGVGLPSILASVGRADLVNIATVPWNQQAFFSDLLSVVGLAQDRTLAPTSQFDAFTKDWSHRESNLVMRSKTYLARGDERAYIVDGDAIRLLIGGMLQAIMLPASIARRRQLPSEQVHPATGKNIVAKSLQVASNCVALIAVSDTSSFTSSGVNQWIALLALLTGITTYVELSELTCSINMRFGIHIIETNLVELLQLYLYLTVGVSCLDEESGEYYISQGGYLGVAANITTALLAQSFTLSYLARDLSKQFDCRIQFQSGGDDIITIVIGSMETVLLCADEVRHQLTTFVGCQKEFNIRVLGPVGPLNKMLPSGLTFCKKEIYFQVKALSSGGVLATLASKRSYPLLVELLTPRPRGLETLHKEWDSYISAAREAVRGVSNPDEALRVYAFLYATVKDVPLSTMPVLMERTITYDIKIHDWIERESLLFTHKAWDLVGTVQAVTMPDGSRVEEQLNAKVSYLLARKQIRLVSTGGLESVSGYALAKEVSRSKRVVRSGSILVPPSMSADDEAELIELVTKLKELVH